MISYVLPAPALVTGSVLTAIVLTLSVDHELPAKKADRLEQSTTAAPAKVVVDNFK